MQIIASAPQPAGYVTIIPHNVPSRASPARYGAFMSAQNKRVVPPLAAMRRVMRHPLMNVLGVLAVAVAAKGGCGACAAGGVLSAFPVYFGAATAVAAIRTWSAAWHKIGPTSIR